MDLATHRVIDTSWAMLHLSEGTVIADFIKNGTDTLLYGGSAALLGLIDPSSGKGIWQGPAYRRPFRTELSPAPDAAF